MRKIYVLMIIVGAIAAFAYPWYVENRSGSAIGSFAAYRRTTGFTPVTVVLSKDQSPVRVFVDLTPIKGYYPDSSRTMLTLTASINGKTLMASKLSFLASSAETRSLQNADKIFRDQAGDLVIEEPGEYHFLVGEGDMEELSLKQVDLVLRAQTELADPRAQPAGFALLALGALGFIRARRRKNTAAEAQPAAPTPPKEPEKPKWGRDAADE